MLRPREVQHVFKWHSDDLMLELGDGTTVYDPDGSLSMETGISARCVVLSVRERRRLKAIFSWGYWLMVAYVALPREFVLAQLAVVEVSTLQAYLTFLAGLIAIGLVWNLARWRFLARCKPRDPRFRLDDTLALAEKDRLHPIKRALPFFGVLFALGVVSPLLDLLLT